MPAAEAEEPIKPDSWQDAVNSWLALADLLPVIQAEGGMAVLECIFSDEGVLRGCGWGKLFMSTGGEPPDDLLKFLKRDLGKHIQTNAYRYRMTLERELARIRRIYELKDKAFQALWAVFAAAMISLFGLLARWLWVEYMYGESTDFW